MNERQMLGFITGSDFLMDGGVTASDSYGDVKGDTVAIRPRSGECRMHKRKPGSSDLEVSALGLGAHGADLRLRRSQPRRAQALTPSRSPAERKPFVSATAANTVIPFGHHHREATLNGSCSSVK